MLTVRGLAMLPNREREFEKRFNDLKEQIDAIYYDNRLALVNQSNLITGWSPSTSDSLADDWIVLD